MKNWCTPPMITNKINCPFCSLKLLTIERLKVPTVFKPTNWNSFLSHCIIDSFPRISKWRIMILKTTMELKAWTNKTSIHFMIFILSSGKIVCNKMQYIIFQYGWKPVLIPRISIGFKAILESRFFFNFSYIKWTSNWVTKNCIINCWNWKIIKKINEPLFIKCLDNFH